MSDVVLQSPHVTVTQKSPSVLTTMLDVVSPVFHKYEQPEGVAVSITLPPTQNSVSPVMLTSGLGCSVTVMEATSVQPNPLVTSTVNVPLSETVMDAVVAPVLHKYVPPPVAVRTVEPPSQKSVSPVIFASGFGCSITVIDATSVQPNPLVTSTV